ncbi:hypothetical protein OA2633_03811 [Oceanicaulis sp. HTCC2633]|uniref:hypothetical protein n=1 Tax=Oceanicaulis sp. HTCC2633 TaxID=314254 RepID=UPI000066D411|nr:hypothetical protein [Oceanicaulis sp. HTCC2633]EAP91270.1 hypothetical protein OA2633_03811 [Oceanicaulis sp. HTCC2633]
MRFEYQPTPYAKVSFHERALRWWLREVRALLEPAQQRIGWRERHQVSVQGRDVLCLMPDHLGFRTRMTLPQGEADQHKRGLALKLDSLLPLPPRQLTVVMGETPEQKEESARYAIVAFRNSDLQAWTEELLKGGARSVSFALESEPELKVLSEAGYKRHIRQLGLSYGSWAALTGALWLALVSWNSALERESDLLTQREAKARTHLVELRDALSQAELNSALGAGLDYSSISTLRSDLTAIMQDLPPAAALRSLTWSPDHLGMVFREEAPESVDVQIGGWWRSTEVTGSAESAGLQFQRLSEEASE